MNLDGLHGWDHEAMTTFRDASPDEFRKVTAEWTADAEKHWSVENGELVNDGYFGCSIQNLAPLGLEGVWAERA